MSLKKLMPLIKLGLLGVIFYWLVSSGKLKLSDLSKYGSDPKLLIYLLLTWSISFVFLGALRWKIICNALKISKSYFSMINLHMIGTFFNVAMPGAVGGDFIKAFYLFKEDEGTTKTTAFLSVFLDRLSGLLGLFIFGFSCFLAMTHDPFSNKEIFWRRKNHQLFPRKNFVSQQIRATQSA